MATPLITDEMLFLTEIDMIDNQHKKLTSIINNLHMGIMDVGKDREQVFKQAAQECIAYVKTHFSDEEKLLLETKYPEFNQHKKMHADYIWKLIEETENFEKGSRVAPNRFVKFLSEWLIHHIAVQDKKYVLFLRKVKPDLFVK